MSAHLDADRLSDLDEGLLPGSEAAEAREHLASCGPCQDLHAQLREVRLLLASVPDPGPMPAEVSARIDAALSVEAARPVDEPASGQADRPAPEASGATVTALPSGAARSRPRRRTARLTTALQVAAAVIVVGGLGAVGLGAVLNGSSGSNDSTTAAGGSVARGPEAAGPLAAAAAPKLTASGHAYTKRGLPTDAARLQRGVLPNLDDTYDTADEGALPSAPGAPTSTRVAPPPADSKALVLPPRAALDACAAALAADEPRAPIAVDAGRFEGRPALVYLFPNPERPGQVDVFVVAPDCRPGQENVLHYAVAPRT